MKEEKSMNEEKKAETTEERIGFGSSDCYADLNREQMLNLRNWYPMKIKGVCIDLSHIMENPFKAFEGKRILQTYWTPGGVDIEFYDGSRGYIDLMIHQDQFNADCGRMLSKGELYITADLRE